jgi:predicted ATPase/DNA-binding CsgD family transcriptional regulator
MVGSHLRRANTATDMIVRPVLCRAFIGRREELAYLHERRREAASSHGGLVLIAGDAGVGKSRLITEFCGSLLYSRWKIGQGTCLQFANRPYGPIIDVLARVDAHPFALGAATKREQFDAIIDRFKSIALRTALAVVIEDVHWADAATLDVLAYLGSTLERMRVLVLASFRSDELHAENPATVSVAKIARNARAGRIDLSPLRGIELRSFIDEALGDIALPEETRRAVALAADGNPFFTEELLKSAVEKSSENESVARDRELPHLVRATLLERLRPFDEPQRRILTQAALIGRTFGLQLLATTLQSEPEVLLSTLRRARDFQLVEEIAAGQFRFRHDLTRAAICGNVLGAEMRPRHRAIALALETSVSEKGSLEALGFHWWAAGDALQSARYNELAGDAATNVHAHEDAIACYERALELPGMESARRGSILEKIANRRIVQTMTAEGEASYRAAADEFRAAGSHEREAVCRVRAAVTAYTIHLADTTGPLEEMLERLDLHEYMARSQLHCGIAWLAATLGFPTRAAHHLESVDPRARSSATDIRVRYHNVAAWVATSLGDVDRFRREHACWLEAARARGAGAIAGARYNGAKCFSSFGLHEEAIENIEQALLIARESRNRHAEECAHATAALCYVMCGDLERARAAVELVPTTTDNRVNATFAAAAGTVVGAHLGDERLIAKWFDGFESSISPAPEIECGYGFAEIMVRRARSRDAAALLHRALPEAEMIRGETLTMLAVARYGEAADRVRARAYLVRAAGASNELPERPTLALFDAIGCLQTEQRDEAAAFARVAAEGFRRLRFPLLEAISLEVAGDAEAALVVYRRCGATYDIHRLEAKRPVEHHATPRENGERAGALSAREREVAALAADGISNLEIARNLSITHKTVEKHLASVYRKLGVSSRSHLGPYVDTDVALAERTRH